MSVSKVFFQLTLRALDLQGLARVFRKFILSFTCSWGPDSVDPSDARGKSKVDSFIFAFALLMPIHRGGCSVQSIRDAHAQVQAYQGLHDSTLHVDVRSCQG